MKTLPLIAGIVGFAAVFVSPGTAAAPAAPPAATTAVDSPNAHILIVFDHPRKFTDIKDNSFATDQDKIRILAMLSDFIKTRASCYLPPGYGFGIRFTDIKLAGALPHGVLLEHRVLTRGAPPTFEFTWAVTDHSGAIVKKGAARLTDSNFMEVYGSATDTDPYHFDKAVLDAWMRENIQKA